MSDFRIRPAGDAALVVEFGDAIDRRHSELVVALAEQIRSERVRGVIETTPTFRSLFVSFDPDEIGHDELAQEIAAIFDRKTRLTPRKRRWQVPACYDPDLAPDLEDAANKAGLTVRQFAGRHSSIVFYVYMLGFLPGQPYLGDLPDDLVMPRLASPRPRVEAGSIGIAMRMTCIFPRPTPCGLRIIARTPISLFDPEHPDRRVIEPGDEVVFQPIDRRDFEQAAAFGGGIGVPPHLLEGVKDARFGRPA